MPVAGKTPGTIAAALLLCAAAAGPGFGQGVPQRTISHIGGGVYRATNNNHGTVFLVTSEGIVLADPLSPDFALWLRNELNVRFGAPVRYVVYSHHHWDHASGGSVFADTARFVGHANMLEHLAMPPASTALAEVVGQYAPVAALDLDDNDQIDREEARAGGVDSVRFSAFDADQNGLLTGAEVMRGPVSQVRPPQITYTDEIEISIGGKRVHMQWVGEMNHSLDSSLIAFPDDGVMFVVDYVTFGRLPYREMDYELGRFDEWMEKIAEAERLAASFEHVATGHGPVGTAENITQWREYFEQLRDEVAAAIAAGRTLEQMQQEITMPDYRHWEGHDWVAENVLGMYHFLTD
jgi:glyoxylase-like metal-dependent hydrolase (beta-lactamase superfamily II)